MHGHRFLQLVSLYSLSVFKHSYKASIRVSGVNLYISSFGKSYVLDAVEISLLDQAIQEIGFPQFQRLSASMSAMDALAPMTGSSFHSAINGDLRCGTEALWCRMESCPILWTPRSVGSAGSRSVRSPQATQPMGVGTNTSSRHCRSGVLNLPDPGSLCSSALDGSTPEIAFSPDPVGCFKLWICSTSATRCRSGHPDGQLSLNHFFL